MSKKIATFVIAGTACGLASAQSTLDIERAYTAELMADAANRSSLLQGAGEGSGFTMTSGDGSSTLTTNALFQFRYVANFRDDANNGVGTDNDFTHGFEIPRARIDWSGNLINDNLTYRISGDFGEINTGGSNNFIVTWAYGQYEFEGMEGAFVRFGQFKAPLMWEELVDAEFQLAADRSVAGETFSQQYSQGLMFGYEQEAWRGYFAFTDGINSVATNYNDGVESDWAVTARGEFKIAGDWARFTDFTSWRNSDYAAKVGAAVHYEQIGETGNLQGAAGGGGRSALGPIASPGDQLLYTVDAAVEGNGWNAFAAFYGSSSEADNVSNSDFNDFGVVAQAGVFVTDQVELFGRYDGIFLDSDRNTTEDTFNFAAIGMNYYFFPESHAVKATLDLLMSFDKTVGTPAAGATPAVQSLFGQGVGTAVTPTSFLGQSDDTEFAIRGQVSVLF
jgi:hypothetical protein